jgi:cation/acetate symporter
MPKDEAMRASAGVTHAPPRREIRTAVAAHGGAPRANDAESSRKRLNFIALVICLMIGTASLPHILMRYYTTPSVKEARESVFWSLFFIFLLYVTAPAYAVFAKYEIYTNLVGSTISTLPGAGWPRGARSDW